MTTESTTTDDPKIDRTGRAVRTGQIQSDRVCTGCGYNLNGQLIVREEHYDLLIVRCPECGAVASVQEYPLLGKWANRWGMVLAALLALVLVAAWPLSGAAMLGFSFATCDEADSIYYRYLADRAEAEMLAAKAAEQAAKTGAPAVAVAPESPEAAAIIARDPAVMNSPNLTAGVARAVFRSNSFSDWWEVQDPDAILAEAGGFNAVVDWRALAMWVPAVLTIFSIGCLWSVMLMHVRRRALVVPWLFIVGLAAAFTVIAIAVNPVESARSAYSVARAQLSPRLLVCSMGVFSIALGLGFAFGRPIVRRVLRLFLAPRLLAPFAGLWTAEGLPAPATRARREA